MKTKNIKPVSRHQNSFEVLNNPGAMPSRYRDYPPGFGAGRTPIAGLNLEFKRENFEYGLKFSNYAGLTTVTQNLQIGADADFVFHKFGFAIWQVNPAFVYTPQAAFTLQMTDLTGGYQFFSAPIILPLLEQPTVTTTIPSQSRRNPFPTDYQFLRNSVIQFELSSPISGAFTVLYDVYISLGGWKLFK